MSESAHVANAFVWGACPSRHFPHLALGKTPGGQWMCDACGTEAGESPALPLWPPRVPSPASPSEHGGRCEGCGCSHDGSVAGFDVGECNCHRIGGPYIQAMPHQYRGTGQAPGR